jgi:FAD/FMN-containing dehydrogenase
MTAPSADLLEKLAAIVGPKGIIEDEMRGPGAIVRPASTQEVSAVLKACNDAGQAIVPMGGNTTMVQGTARLHGEIALSLERMNKIIEVDLKSRTMIVEAGAILQTVQERAEEEGLLFPLDLGARGSATIGGNISTNAGGNRVIRYGMTRELVLALETVLADGTVLPSQGKALKNNTGYDLKHLFIGGEGTLGVVTRATLRLYPQVTSDNCAWVAVPTFDALTKFLAHMESASAGTLSSFEVLWQDYYEFQTGDLTPHGAPLAHGQDFYVLLENLGADQARDSARFEEILGQALEQEIIVDAVIAKSEAERDAMWEIRDDVFQLVHIAPLWAFDVSLAIGDMDTYTNDLKAALMKRWPEHRLMIFGHLGDGNLHVIVSVGDDSEEAHHAVEEVVYAGVRTLNGSVSAEHGIGLEKRDYLNWTRSDEEIALMKQIKALFDPKGILNPGKVFKDGTERLNAPSPLETAAP